MDKKAGASYDHAPSSRQVTPLSILSLKTNESGNLEHSSHDYNDPIYYGINRNDSSHAQL